MEKQANNFDKDTSDEVLLNRIKLDDQNAYRILVDRYLGKLWRLGVNVLCNESEAEEVVQEVLLTVWKNRHKWDDAEAKFSTWVYRVTLNRCIDIKRKRRPTTDTEIIEKTMPSEATLAADKMLIEDENKQHLKETLERIPPKQKEALLLYYYEELNVKEISVRISTTEDGVRSLLKRGRKNLRDFLKYDTRYEDRGIQGST